MSGASRSGNEPGQGEGSWAAESLPLEVRKELLERELRKMGFRKAEARAAGGAQQQPQSQDSSSHPQADGDPGEHGD